MSSTDCWLGATNRFVTLTSFGLRTSEYVQFGSEEELKADPIGKFVRYSLQATINVTQGTYSPSM